MTTAQETVLAKFRRAFPESEGGKWNNAQGFGDGDNGNRYMRLEYASGASIYFPLGVGHAHIVPRSVRNFRPRAEDLQRCLEKNRVPKGCEDQYVVESQHADAIIAVLRNS